MPAPHLKGTKQLPANKIMGAVPDGLKAWVNIRTTVPPPYLDGGQMTQADYLAMWTAWVAAFTAPTIALYTAPAIQPGPLATWASLTEPLGTWYTPGGVATVVTGPWLNSDGSVEVGTNSHTFVYSGVSAPDNIQGCALVDTF